MNTLEKIKNRKKKFEHKSQLQNELILSFCFVLYAVAMSMASVFFSTEAETKKHLNEEINQYFSISNEKIYFKLLYSISFVPLIQDGIVILVLCGYALSLLLYQIWIDHQKKKKQPSEEDDRAEEDDEAKKEALLWWRFCAYSSFFSLACILNHLNFIIIAFIHNLYHATSITIVYGIIIVIIILMLN